MLPSEITVSSFRFLLRISGGIDIPENAKNPGCFHGSELGQRAALFPTEQGLPVRPKAVRYTWSCSEPCSTSGFFRFAAEGISPQPSG